MASTPNQDLSGRWETNEPAAGSQEENEGNVSGESSLNIEPTSTENGSELWNPDMELPQGKPRPTFVGESEEDRITGNGTVEDPKIVWLGKIPLLDVSREANQNIARQVARSLKGVTHVYIRCAAQSSRFIDRDGKRINIRNPDSIRFYHQTTAADPHISLAFGTDPDNLVLDGYIHVTIDENGNPVDLATSRNRDLVFEDDDRILELFPYEADQQFCAPYCPVHGDHEALIDACDFVRSQGCLTHDTEGLLDHFCRRTRWKSEAYGDHYCPCSHDTAGLIDHYCPCQHDQSRWQRNPRACHHRIPRHAREAHYCPSYLF